MSEDKKNKVINKDKVIREVFMFFLIVLGKNNYRWVSIMVRIMAKEYVFFS